MANDAARFQAIKIIREEADREHRNLCDKCGKPVPVSNDATVLDMILYQDLSLLYAQSRHLLPTDGCEGSPSRAQYLPSQEKDQRGYEYDHAWEYRVRRAYDFIKDLEVPFEENV